MSKRKKAKAAKAAKATGPKKPGTPWYETTFPVGFKPEPTVICGDTDKMARCYEAMRDLDTGGWGGGFLKRVKGWGFGAHLGDTISCSPFTGTVISMMFDRGKDGEGVDPQGDDFAPTFNGDDPKPLPNWFYHFHNSSLPDSHEKGKENALGWREALAHLSKIGVTRSKKLGSHYGSVGAVALWNLGYQIDPRDMRRGDHVHVDWLSGHGHATFCWDVHLDADGAVDAYTFVSANGSGDGDVGVGVSSSPLGYFVNDKTSKYMAKVKVKVDPKGREYSKKELSKFKKAQLKELPTVDKMVEKTRHHYTKKPEFDPLFVDRPEFVTRGSWKLIPPEKRDPKKPERKASIEAVKASKTFKPAAPDKVSDNIKTIFVIRFWGFPPPDKTTPRGKLAWADPTYSVNFTQAEALAKYTQPAPYCMGEGRAVTPSVHKVAAVAVPAARAQKPADLAQVPTTPAVQRPEHATTEQLEVERALNDLFHAGWIDTGPGDTANVFDQETVKSLKSFQKRYGLKEDGQPGRVTRPLLFAAAADLRAGRSQSPKPPPEVAHPPAPKPAHAAAHPHAPAPKPAPKPAAAPVMLGPVAGTQPHLERFYWLQNHALPGDTLAFAVEGVGLDVLTYTVGQVELTEKTLGTTVYLDVPIPFTVGGHGQGSVVLPKEVAAGTVWAARLICDLPGGTSVADSPVELGVTQRPPAERVADSEGWAWDERTWPASMRNILQELRTTPAPKPPFYEQWALSTYGVKEKMNSLGPRDKHTRKLKYADGGDLVPVLHKDGTEFGRVTRYSLYAADIEGTMRVGGRVLNITQKGRARGGKPPHRYEEFDHTQSRWHDVTDQHPWGSGSRVPLIPYRVLAVNSAHDTWRYFQKVYIKALDGVRLAPTGEVHNGVCVIGDCGSMDTGKQFDFFKGRQDITFKIDGGLGMFKNSKGVSLPLSDVAFLGECATAAALRAKKKKR